MSKQTKIPSTVVREAERCMNRAMGALLDEGNWLKSVQYLQRAMEIDPGYLPPYYELADIYFQIGHSQAVLGVVQKALEIDPKDYQSNFNLGNIYLIQDKVDEALAIYKKLENVFQDSSPDLLLNVATAYHAKRKFHQALRYIQRVLSEDASYIEAYELKGKILFEQGKFSEAKIALKKVLELDRNHLNAIHLLAVMYSRESRWQMAIREWKKEVALAPDRDEPYGELGWAYLRIGEEGKALPLLKKALELNPDNLQARMDLGTVFLNQFQFEKAISQWETCERCNPKNKRIRKFVSQVRLSRKKSGGNKKELFHLISSFIPSRPL